MCHQNTFISANLFELYPNCVSNQSLLADDGLECSTHLLVSEEIPVQLAIDRGRSTSQPTPIFGIGILPSRDLAILIWSWKLE